MTVKTLQTNNPDESAVGLEKDLPRRPDKDERWGCWWPTLALLLSRLYWKWSFRFIKELLEPFEEMPAETFTKYVLPELEHLAFERDVKATYLKLAKSYGKHFSKMAVFNANYLLDLRQKRDMPTRKKIRKLGGRSRKQFEDTVYETLTGFPLERIKIAVKKAKKDIDDGIIEKIDSNGLFKLAKPSKKLVKRFSDDQAAKFAMRAAKWLAIAEGFDKAYWWHTKEIEKYPRKSHIDFDYKLFSLIDGALIDGEHIFCGEKYGCRCFFTLP